MIYTDIALKVLAAKEIGLIKTNAQFITEFSEREKFEEIILRNERIGRVADTFIQQFATGDEDEGFICAFDDNFPLININVKNGDKPYLLFYKGDISLLSDLNKNVAVIGLIDPTPQIEKREIEVVGQLVKSELIVVSGLAKGCDAIAHKVCVNTGNKTIAILPSQISKITPAVNRSLAKEIVINGGLLLTEYYKEPLSRQDAIGRFIERDRLQAMFSKAVVLIASYRKNEGDSGSRHAMEAARNYRIDRFVMFNETTDLDDKQFGLNKDFVKSKAVKILNKGSIETIKKSINSNLINNQDCITPKQLKILI